MTAPLKWAERSVRANRLAAGHRFRPGLDAGEKPLVCQKQYPSEQASPEHPDNAADKVLKGNEKIAIHRIMLKLRDAPSLRSKAS